MMHTYYVLDPDGTARPVGLHEWAEWFETADRRIALTQITGMHVSTVFLALDHSFTADGPPTLFESMVFYGSNGGCTERYSTRDEALAGHEAICEAMRKTFVTLRRFIPQIHPMYWTRRGSHDRPMHPLRRAGIARRVSIRVRQRSGSSWRMLGAFAGRISCPPSPWSARATCLDRSAVTRQA